MIGAINKIHSKIMQPDKKEIISLSLSGTLHNELLQHSAAHNVSKSELTEFALRKLFNLDCENIKQKLIIIYK